jgi:hypothetical protein
MKGAIPARDLSAAYHREADRRQFRKNNSAVSRACLQPSRAMPVD